MSALVTEGNGQLLSLPGPGLQSGRAVAAREVEQGLAVLVAPNALTRWAFYLSAFSIPFVRLYVPGTGDRLGVIRIVQLLFICAAAAQPRICLRFLPAALGWLGAYCILRLLSGLWLSPELWQTWWPTTLDWLQYSLPWVWVMFNLLQFPQVRRNGLWAFGWGCALCAALHAAGLGVSAVDNSVNEVRTTIFGENANIVGETYAAGLIVLIGLAMANDVKLSRRWVLFPMIGLVGIGVAKTGSRTALVMVALGTLVLLLQHDRFSSKGRRYSALLLLGVVMAAVISQIPTVVARFSEIDPHDIGRLNPRARMAPVLVEMFLRSPIYGSGPDQYEYELTRRAMPYLIREQKTISSHNLVLLLLVENGIIGLVIFGVAMRQAVLAAWRGRHQPGGSLPLALFLPFVLSGIVLSNPTTNHVFWFALAYALAAAA